MKAHVIALLILPLICASADAAAASPACEAKRARIQTQITEATANGRKQELKGLQKALKANQANCTDESLARERDSDISRAKRDVDSRRRDLQDAERKGDPAKIAKRKAKLEEAQSDLAEAERPLLP